MFYKAITFVLLAYA